MRPPIAMRIQPTSSRRPKRTAHSRPARFSSNTGNATFETLPYLGGVSAVAAASGELTAPMMGKVVAIRAGNGDRVEAGQIVLVLESMKMELHVNAPFDAVVRAVRCGLGDMVGRGDVLAELSADTTHDKE